MTDLTFALMFNWPDGHLAALRVLQPLLPESEHVRGTLVYKKNVLKFEKNPLQGEDGEMDLQISAFPVDDKVDLANQRQILREVRRALQNFAGEVAVLAEDNLLNEQPLD